MLTEKDYFMMPLIYGPVNAFAGILRAAQTSFVMMMSALVAIDAPLQTGWHKKGLDMFYHTEGESAETTRELLNCVHPDFGTPPPSRHRIDQEQDC
jgi:hypothetical protein